MTDPCPKCDHDRNGRDLTCPYCGYPFNFDPDGPDPQFDTNEEARGEK